MSWRYCSVCRRRRPGQGRGASDASRPLRRAGIHPRGGAGASCRLGYADPHAEASCYRGADTDTGATSASNADTRSDTNMDINARSHALRWTRNAYGHLVCTDCVTALTVSKPRPDTLRPVGSDGQRLAINTSNGERLPGGHEAPRDVHDAERGGNSYGHHAGRAEHGALDGKPERNDVSAGNAGA